MVLDISHHIGHRPTCSSAIETGYWLSALSAVFVVVDVRVARTAVQVPNKKPFAELCAGKFRRELLEYVLTPGDGRLEPLAAEHVPLHNDARPHQPLGHE